MDNTAQYCRLGLFQDSDFAGDLEDSKSTLGGVLCIFGSRTLLPIIVGCAINKRQYPTVLQSLKSFLWKLDYACTLDRWDIVIEVLRSTNNTARQGRLAQGDLCGTGDHSIHKNKSNTPTEKRKREVEQLSNVDSVPTSTHSSQGESELYIFEDNEAVIKMIIKGRSPTMRHVSRYHRVALDRLFDRINLDPKIQIKFVDTRKTNLLKCDPKCVSSVTSGTISSSYVQPNGFLDILLQPFHQFSF